MTEVQGEPRLGPEASGSVLCPRLIGAVGPRIAHAQESNLSIGEVLFEGTGLDVDDLNASLGETTDLQSVGGYDAGGRASTVVKREVLASGLVRRGLGVVPDYVSTAVASLTEDGNIGRASV